MKCPNCHGTGKVKIRHDWFAAHVTVTDVPFVAYLRFSPLDYATSLLTLELGAEI